VLKNIILLLKNNGAKCYYGVCDINYPNALEISKNILQPIDLIIQKPIHWIYEQFVCSTEFVNYILHDIKYYTFLDYILDNIFDLHIQIDELNTKINHINMRHNNIPFIEDEFGYNIDELNTKVDSGALPDFVITSCGGLVLSASGRFCLRSEQ